MRCYVSELNKFLAKNINVFLLYGTEQYLIQDTIDTLLAKITAKHSIERQVFNFDGHGRANFTEILAVSKHQCLFSENVLLQCNFSTTPKPNESKDLISLVDNIDNNTILLIQMGSLNKKHLQSKWFSAIDQHGLCIAHWSLSQAQFVTWLKQKLPQYKLNLTDDALALLANYTQGNYLSAVQELNKLSLCSTEPKQIASNDLEKLIFNQGRFQSFDLIQAVLSKQPKQVVLILQGLQTTTALPLLIWSMHQCLQVIFSCANTNNNISLKLRLQQSGLPIKLLSCLQGAINSRHLPSKNSIFKLHTIDKNLKSGLTSEAWLEFSDFCLELAATTVNT